MYWCTFRRGPDKARHGARQLPGATGPSCPGVHARRAARRGRRSKAPPQQVGASSKAVELAAGSALSAIPGATARGLDGRH
jgi:hypothetical protein